MTQMTQYELDNRIHAFLERKSKKFPEMHLLDANDITPMPHRGRSSSVWYRAVHGI